MKLIALFLLSALYFSGSAAAQSEASKRHDLWVAQKKAIDTNAPIEERRKIALQLKNHIKDYGPLDATLTEYSQIGDLLKNADDPKDVLEAVTAYDYFLRNTKTRYGYNFPNDYPEQETTLALLLISKYYYYWKTGELPMDAKFTIAEAVRWFDGALNNNSGDYDFERARMKNAATAMAALQKINWRGNNNNQQAYTETMEIINRYSALFLCKLGDVIKYRDKKQAKKWYKDAWGLGYTDAANHLARIDNPRPKTLQDYGYPAADYIEQRLPKQEAKDYSTENKAYNEWWNKTYGKGGTQNSTPIPNNNTSQATYKTGTPSEESRHQQAMDQIYRDTKKQMERSFRNH